MLASLGWNQWRNPLIFALMLLLDGIVDMIWAYSATGYYFKLYKPKKTLLIYRNKLDKHRFGSIKGKPSERLYKIADELM